MSDHYTYILRCADGSLYTGWTTDLERRLAAHNAGTASKYTRSRRPVALVYHESFPTKEEAMAREWAVKQLSRAEKLALIHKKPSKKLPAQSRTLRIKENGSAPEAVCSGPGYVPQEPVRRPFNSIIRSYAQ